MGTWIPIMLRMSVYYEKENKINSKVKNAMIYPAILAIVAAGAVAVILTFVMPTFMEMFAENGVELPWLTKVLLWTSDFITSQYLSILILDLLLGSDIDYTQELSMENIQ